MNASTELFDAKAAYIAEYIERHGDYRANHAHALDEVCNCVSAAILMYSALSADHAMQYADALTDEVESLWEVIWGWCDAVSDRSPSHEYATLYRAAMYDHHFILMGENIWQLSVQSTARPVLDQNESVYDRAACLRSFAGVRHA